MGYVTVKGNAYHVPAEVRKYIQGLEEELSTMKESLSPKDSPEMKGEDSSLLKGALGEGAIIVNEIKLSEQDASKLVEALEQPTTPNTMFIEAARRYKKLFDEAPIILDDETFDKVVEACDNPPEPNEHMKEIIELSNDENFTLTFKQKKFIFEKNKMVNFDSSSDLAFSVDNLEKGE